jgi:DNA repair protein NreA
MDADQPLGPPVVDPRGKSREEVIAAIPPELCVRCKGARLLCGLARCPILDSIREQLPRVQVKSKELEGSSPPTLFVGRHGYPAVRVGPMLPPTHLAHASQLDDPRNWIHSANLREVVAMRASLLRSNEVVRVDEPRNPSRVLQAAQLLAMASKPADVEVTLSKVPTTPLQPKVDSISAPMGPSLAAERARVVSNPSVPRKVDALVGDTHARASEAVGELYTGGIDAYHIQRLLSAGLLGRGQHRKLVPTRWSITATDDILAQPLIERVKASQQLGGVELFTSEHYGNRFWLLLLPREWGFEMLERWHAGSVWSRGGSAAGVDWEDWRGRSSYASNVGGAYYAARLSILEHLVARQRQAQPIVYREITDAYLFPLGVWVIRESVRDALALPSRSFDNLEAAVRTISMECSVATWYRESNLLREARVQRRLTDYGAVGGGGLGGGT